MKNIPLYVYSLLLLAPGTIFAKNLSGTVELGYQHRGDQAEHNAKAVEYTDKDQKVLGNVFLNYENGSYYTDAVFQDIGYDGQSYDFSGGHYNKFKYNLGYSELIHNVSLDNKSFYTGVGTAAQTGTANSNVASWNNFDVFNNNKKLYAEIDYKLFGTYSVALKADQQNKEGIGAYAINSGTSSSGNFAETGMPIDFKTTNVTLEGRHEGESLFVNLLASLSKFENKNPFFTAQNFASGANSTINTIAPESDMLSFELNSVLRDLPLNSNIALNGSYSTITNEFDLKKTNFDGTAETVNVNKFEGDISYSSAKLAISSNPFENFFTKIYGKYLNKVNTSTGVTYDDTTSNHHFGYNKTQGGLELAYKLPFNTKTDVGYEFSKINRQDREDAEKSKDHTAFIGFKNHITDMVTTRLKLTHLDREAAATKLTHNYTKFAGRFDVTDKRMDQGSVAVDLALMENLDVSLGFNHTRNDYHKTALGVQDDTRNAVIADVGYSHSWFKINAYGELEKLKKNAAHRIGAGTNPNPGSTATTAVYNWYDERREDVYSYGANIVVPLMSDKLNVTVAYDGQTSDTDLNFTIQPPATTTNNGEDIADYGDYRSTKVSTKVDYSFNEKFSGALTGIYERLKVSDVQYIQNAGVLSSNYYGGIGNDLTFNDTTIIGSVAYHF